MDDGSTTKASLDLNDISGFIDDCFDPTIRSESAVISAVKSGALDYTFVDDASCATIFRAWLAAWQKAAKDTYDAAAEAQCPPYDPLRPAQCIRREVSVV